MLNKDQLLQLGYEINPDPDQPGMYYWKNDTEGSEISFGSEAVTVLSANLNAIMGSDLHVCDNCGKIHTDEMLLVAKDLGQRVAPGGVYPSGECSDCGVLCYPVEPLPDWDDVMAYFGLDPSFMYADKDVAEFTFQYIQSIAAEEKKARTGEMAIEALAKIRAQPNCRHEVEAQLGAEMWDALSAEQPVAVETDRGRKVIELLEEADSYLREIRAENLDGSEPALGELLERLTGLWTEVGDIKAAPVTGSDADYTVAVEVQVTAESHEEAARFALDDLRDRSLQEWNMTVTNSSGSKVVTVPGNPEEKAEGDTQVSLDGGETYQNAPNGVRLIYKRMPIPDDGYEAGELHVNATHEGLILDVWATRKGLVLDENIGTSSQMATDIVARMVEASD